MAILDLSREGGKCGVQHCDKISPFAAIHTFVIPRGIYVVARWQVIEKFGAILLGMNSKRVSTIAPRPSTARPPQRSVL